MKRARSPRRAPRKRAALIAGALALACVLIAAGALLPTGAPLGGDRIVTATAQSAPVAPVPQTDASIPASDVTMIGVSSEAAGSTWGVGEGLGGMAVVRYAKQGGEGAWTLVQELPSFKLARSPLAAQMAPDGAGVLLGTGAQGEKELLVRDPGGSFAPTAPVPSEGQTLAKGEEPLLHKGEALFSSGRAPLLAPLEEEGQGAGALLAPVQEAGGTQDERQILHWNGHKWTSESIEIPANSKEGFRVLALAASAPNNAWLLAQLSSRSSYPAGAVALFRRVSEGEGENAKWLWKPVVAKGAPKPEEAEPLTVPVYAKGAPEPAQPFTVHGTGEPPTIAGALLTVTGEGVWIDGERTDVQAPAPMDTTLFYKPEAIGSDGTPHGYVEQSWCLLPSAAPAGTPECGHTLPEALPSGPYRSFAWANGSQFGERVISGLAEGVSLSLAPTGSFARVLALGSGSGSEEDPGALYGAAFANAGEGWLGDGLVPVHLTAPSELAPTRLTPWPTSFRHPLLAIAPQPGAAVGSLTSEALAVGDLGAVARFKPGVGWLPESLFGPGQRVEHPRLRAVSWPTPTRAYAVGDYSSQSPNMWLWRAETGLWEPDPAMPLNFRGNLLGIAFDPDNPARGYAVGSSTVAETTGVLLRYGKTWTQETALPAQVQGASFTAIAFAGSEAIVAYRHRLSTESGGTTGGLLVGDGSGWSIDQQAATVAGGAVPLAVAGLPDGAAAFLTKPASQAPRLYEREAPGAPWRAMPVPLPNLQAGSIALFREGGALRAIVASGGVANAGEPPKAPPGFPPNFLPALPPVEGGAQSVGVLRQTATGWRDESHELNPAREPAGGYVAHDLPYRPDPIMAVLIDPSGAQGWAVGGNIDNSEGGRLETADIYRYPADGTAPLGAGTTTMAPEVPAHENRGEARDVTVAVGGGAQCAAPCAARAFADVGPEVWLTDALTRAHQVAGARAFLYTGPYMTAAEVNGPRSVPVPFAQELERYASILRSSPLPVYATAAPAELDARPERDGDERIFEEALAGVEPFGAGVSESPRSSRPSEQAERKLCSTTPGCEADYYAIKAEGPTGTVRVIALDDGLEVATPQLEWLEGQLEAAKREGTPAIVFGNGDLAAQAAAGGVQATHVIAALVGGPSRCRETTGGPCGASAYFYDAPEENVRRSLRAVVGGKEQSIEAFGSGTLGYVSVTGERFGDFHGASGFLLAQVEMATYNRATNRATVTPRLIPNVGELALEAHDGILLRRSSVASFQGLARRPRAGGRAGEKGEESVVDPYVPIPENCVGASCVADLFPEYTFTSSRPDIGQFVARNLQSPDPSAVQVGAGGLPVPDEPRNPHSAAHELTADGHFYANAKGEPINERGETLLGAQSSLFCAYNAGRTIVTISAGGLSASLPVTVEAGSVREPCGTVPLKELPPAKQQAASASPPPAPAPGPTQPAPASSPPPVLPAPPPPPPLPIPIAARPAPRPVAPPPFVPLAAVASPVLAFVPPPLPTPARPTPPTGTSAVTSPIEVAEKEEEEESATESASAQAVAYRAGEDEPSLPYLLGAIVLAALAGASIRRPRRGTRDIRVAPATLTAMRSQRRVADRRHSQGRRRDNVWFRRNL